MTPLEALVAKCLGGLETSAEGFVYAPNTVAEIKSSFSALLQGPTLKECTRELLLLAFFLETQRASPMAARALLEVARLAIPVLAARGERFEAVLSTETLARRLGALASSTIPLGQRAGAGGKKWWELKGDAS